MTSLCSFTAETKLFSSEKDQLDGDNDIIMYQKVKDQQMDDGRRQQHTREVDNLEVKNGDGTNRCHSEVDDKTIRALRIINGADFEI